MISSSRKAWGFFHCGTLTVAGNGPCFRHGTHEEVASLRLFLPPPSSSPCFASAALFFFFFTSSSLSSSFLFHQPMIQSALRSLRSVFSTVTLCWLVSRACLNTARWRVNALLTYALAPDEERLTVAAGGQDDDRIRTSWTAAVGQLQLFSLTVGLIDPVVSPCWLSTGWEGQGMCRELSFLSDGWCLSSPLACTIWTLVWYKCCTKCLKSGKK